MSTAVALPAPGTETGFKTFSPNFPNPPPTLSLALFLSAFFTTTANVKKGALSRNVTREGVFALTVQHTWRASAEMREGISMKMRELALSNLVKSCVRGKWVVIFLTEEE